MNIIAPDSAQLCSTRTSASMRAPARQFRLRGVAGMIAAAAVFAATPVHATGTERAAAVASHATQATQVSVDAMLAQMTLEEKAGQMTQLTLSYFSAEPGDDNAIHGIDPDKLRAAIVDLGIGSILNNVTEAFTPQQWRDIIGEIQRIATEESRLGVPILYGIDSVHGANYVRGATIMPQNLTLAATWNPGLAESAGRVTADDSRAVGMNWNFAPDADSGRQPLWSRIFETFGEDPVLASAMVAASVKGMQGDDLTSDDTIAACAKHFVAYSTPRTGHDRTPVTVAPWELYEYHIPAFRAAMAEGVRTIMINSGEVNGVPVHANHDLLTGVLRDELGFDGVAVTDWADVIKLHNFHKVAPTLKEAAYLAVHAGIDMSMTPETTDFTTHVVELVREGRLSESRIDESVRRILTLKRDLGLFERPMADASNLSNIGSDASEMVSLEAAREGIVLLRNRGDVLPLAQGTKVLVTGATADSLTPLYGAWSYTWQGTDASQHPDTPTVLDAARTAFGEDNVIFQPGAMLDGTTSYDAAVRAAADADVILVCLGEEASTEMIGNIADLSLDPEQIELVSRLAATGKPIIAAMISNRPRTFPEVEGAMDAFMWLGQPGPYGPQALTEIMTGAVNPSGRMPITYPRYANSLVLYDRKGSENDGEIDPADGFSSMFEFGEGIGYAPIEYSGLSVQGVNARGDDPVKLRVSVEVTNAGDRDASETVMLFVTDSFASITPSVKRLKAFRKVQVNASGSRTVSFELSQSDLSFYNNAGTLVYEPGEFVIHIGTESQAITIN